jgi:hypothetical protein
MVVEDDRHLAASVEEVDPPQVSVDTHILDGEDLDSDEEGGDKHYADPANLAEEDKDALL